MGSSGTRFQKTSIVEIAFPAVISLERNGRVSTGQAS